MRLNRSLSCIAAALVAVSLLTGCASAPPDRVAKNTIEGCVRAAQNAMRVVGALYQTGHLGNDAYDQATVAYEKFQATARAASKGLRASLGGVPPIDAANDALDALLLDLSGITGKPPSELRKGAPVSLIVPETPNGWPESAVGTVTREQLIRMAMESPAVLTSAEGVR